jgi:hypothetical protein
MNLGCARRLLALMAQVLLGAFVAVAAAHADCPSANTAFVAHTLDYNNDGVPDYAIVPRPVFVALPLDDDMPLVIPVPARVSGFLLLSQPGGARSLQALSGNPLPAGAWQAVPLGLALADVTGSGCNALVVRGVVGASGSQQTAVVRYAGTGQPTALQVLTVASASGYGLADGELIGSDATGDGRQDLVHRIGGLVQGVYVADAQGAVGYDDDATIMAVWNDFLAASLARDSRATLYLSTEVLQRYGTRLNADLLQQMCQGIRDAGILESDPKFAALVVQRAGPGGDSLFTLLFGKTGNGSWRVSQL